MASVRKKGTKWQARWRDQSGSLRARSFPTKGEAKAYGERQDALVRSGDYIDPALSKITIEEWAPQWMRTKRGLEPTTLVGYDTILRCQILPRWGKVQLRRITYVDLAAWQAELATILSPSRVRHVHVVMNQMLNLAVEDGRLARNPFVGKTSRASLPKVTRRKDHNYLSIDALYLLADECHGHRELILVMGHLGPRIGEALALRVRDVDVLGRKVTIGRAQREVSGEGLSYACTKTKDCRVIGVPRALITLLEPLLHDKGPDDLLFTSPQGLPLRYSNWTKRHLAPAAQRAGISLTPHDLRHTAASLAVQSGANVKAIQHMLGHASAAMTLDVYAGLFDTDTEALAERMDEAISRVAVAPAWPHTRTPATGRPTEADGKAL